MTMHRIAYTYIDAWQKSKFKFIDLDIQHNLITPEIINEMTDYICDQYELDRNEQEVFIISVMKYSEQHTLPSSGL